ncbi:MAG: hypothetical protein NT172_15035 [Planctomycetota bacterium]|nr:hypothetical protein [Planctomycetota bacterium]
MNENHAALADWFYEPKYSTLLFAAIGIGWRAIFWQCFQVRHRYFLSYLLHILTSNFAENINFACHGGRDQGGSLFLKRSITMFPH